MGGGKNKKWDWAFISFSSPSTTSAAVDYFYCFHFCRYKHTENSELVSHSRLRDVDAGERVPGIAPYQASGAYRVSGRGGHSPCHKSINGKFGLQTVISR